jgi:RNA polymerase-binding transcription factor DksA
MDPDDARERLAAEHDRLQDIKADLDEIRAASLADGMQELTSNSQHQADIGTETFEREKDLSILDEVEGELADIERALERLDDGTYGTCEACGKPVGDDRLEAMPATRFCLEDQAKAERELRRGTPVETAPDSGA